MTLGRDRVSWLLLGSTVACFAVGAFPRWSEGVDPVSGDKVSECRLGFWSSPLYQHVRRDYRHVAGGMVTGGYRIESRPNWVSWSSLVILIGLSGLALLRWRRTAVADPPDAEPSAADVTMNVKSRRGDDGR
jgi:hypothetical protein